MKCSQCPKCNIKETVKCWDGSIYHFYRCGDNGPEIWNPHNTGCNIEIESIPVDGIPLKSSVVDSVAVQETTGNNYSWYEYLC